MRLIHSLICELCNFIAYMSDNSTTLRNEGIQWSQFYIGQNSISMALFSSFLRRLLEVSHDRSISVDCCAVMTCFVKFPPGLQWDHYIALTYSFTVMLAGILYHDVANA